MNSKIPMNSKLLLIVIPFIYFLCTAEMVNRIVAIVNEDIVTLHELNTSIMEMTGLSAENIKAEDQEKYIKARRKVLEFLIDEKITQEKIKEVGIKITYEDVDKAIENIKKNNHMTQEDLLMALKDGGLSYSKYKENIKKDMERARLINYEVKSKIIIRDEEILRYYEENKDRFLMEGEVHLAGIFLKQEKIVNGDYEQEITKKGEYILARIEKGEDFAKLAKAYSTGPGASEGGYLGKFKISQLDPELRKIVTNMEVGDVSGLITRVGGIQIVKLLEKRSAKERPFDEVKNAIYDILYKEEVNKRYNTWIKDLRENTYTKIIF